MRHRSLPILTTLLAATALASCQEEVAPILDPVDDGPPEAAPEPPRLDPFQDLTVEGYPAAGEVRTGWILDRAGQPMMITYEIHDGLAIWEGDIVIGREGEIAQTPGDIDLGEPGPLRGVVIDGASFRWPGGVVPYVINGALPNQARVTNAIDMVEDQTPGITLVPRDGESDYVEFVVGSGCSSAIGRQSGRQTINLASGCTTGNTAHEILHALGMFHEHTRCDRDTFVQINFDSIESGKEGNFDKQCSGATDIDVYDEGSIMHYPPDAFSVGGRTIVSLRGRESEMGQRSALSDTDTETMNQLYGANNAAPVAMIAPLDASYPEGSFVGLDGSGSSDADDDDDLLTFDWTFGDGTCSGTPPLACQVATTSNQYDDDGSYPVTLTVSDGFDDDAANATVIVDNVAPTVSAGADATVDEGSLWSQAGSFTDPGADTWTATVDYADGAGAEALALSGKTFQLSYTYADNGVNTVEVTVTDDDGGVGTDDVEVTVNNVPPTVDAGPDATVESGQTFDFTGTFSDPGVEDDPWNWVIEWGFGPNTMGSTNDQSAPIEASRQVCVAGTYTVRLTVTDKDGGAGSDEATLTVPYIAVDIDIMPGTDSNPINLGGGGRVPVAILGSATLDASAIDASSLVLGDEVDPETAISQKNNGAVEAYLEDVNGDGYMDLVAMFSMRALVSNGDLTTGSTELVLRGFMDDACTNIRGVDLVTPLGT